MVKRMAAGLAVLGLLVLSGPGRAGSPPDKAGQRDKEERKLDKEGRKIEQVVAGLIDAYLAGDYDAMERYYAPEVVMVSFLHEPPLVGWPNVRQVYQVRQAGQEHLELLRENTLIKRRGRIAWVYYRWSFVGKAAGQFITTLGHTTLILEKRGRNWLIVHNHSSPVLPPVPTPRPTTPPPKPSRP